MKFYLVVKRGVDFAVSLAVLTLGLPVFILIAAAIKLDSEGPVFFTQTRLGGDKKPFRLYKFRTMVKDAEKLRAKYEHLNKAAYPTFKIPQDPRLTRVGGFLRKLHLDELPNFINVLSGEMSVVGFRPPTADEVEKYESWHHERFLGKPGITSLWVVEGYHTASFDDWIRSDIGYGRGCSLPLDLYVMYGTFKVMVKAALGR